MARALLSRFLPVAGAIAALAAGLSVPMQAEAHYVPAPCDFITSGGYVFKDDGAMANFGAHGGCKNGQFWGNVNFVDHGRLDWSAAWSSFQQGRGANGSRTAIGFNATVTGEEPARPWCAAPAAESESPARA